jgi:hypothetical protein
MNGMPRRLDDVGPFAARHVCDELPIPAHHVQPGPVRQERAVRFVGPRDVVAAIVSDIVDLVDSLPFAAKKRRSHDHRFEPQSPLVMHNVAGADGVPDQLGR